ncbi:MAG TPA: CvpA family protein [Terracidiphilus sp.]|nr:CvpA family protein [Terracidiphilus sp.]
MTLTDWTIVAVLALTVLGGLARGFFRSVCSLGGLVLGVALGAWNYPLVAEPLKPLLHSEDAANVAAFIVIAVVVMVAGSILGSLLAKAMEKVGLGCLDRLAGGVFGFFQGALLVTLIILVTVAFYPQARWLTDARLPRHFFTACHLTTHLSPGQLADRVRRGLRMLEGQTEDWLHPHEGKL